MEECCDKGVEWANKNRICTSLPLISESRECRYTVTHYTLHENMNSSIKPWKWQV